MLLKRKEEKIISTQFTNIYDLNEVIKLDSRLQNKPINLIYELYYKYLTFAISYFVDDCYKNLNNLTPFSQIEYEFTGDGVNNQFILDTAPPSNTNFYIDINGNIDGITYSYDVSNLKITVNPIPPLSSTINIASYIIGEFVEDLNMKEKAILAEGMNVPYLEEKRNREELLHQSVYGSDFKMYSQGEHIHQLNNSIDNQYWRTVKTMINDYSFKQNPNGLFGLGGGILNNNGGGTPL